MQRVKKGDKVRFLSELLETRLKENASTSFIFDEKTTCGITFKEFYDLSGRVYAYLKARNIGREDFVLINLERGIKPFAALIGVLRAGAAFTITEDTYPVDRVRYIYQNCSCKTEINEAVWEGILKTEPLSGYEETYSHDAAYAIFTSGTTGNPKGVIHEYGNLEETHESFCYQGRSLYAEDVSFGLISSLSFVASVLFFLPVIAQKKSRFYIISDITKNDPEKLLAYSKENNITTIFLPPSYIKVIGEEKLAIFKTLIVGSELVSGIVPIKGVSVYNTYGMSESGYYVGVFKIDRKYDICPIGRPQFDKKVVLLDEEGKPVEDGETGELCIENPFVRGYIGLLEENQRAFRNGVYHTNDLARRLPNGDYVVLGRKNDMIKIYGCRIEPSEVEAVIMDVLDIDWCGVRGFECCGKEYLVAYYTADSSPVMDTDGIKEKLSKKLPDYMLPSYFIKIDRIPVNKNGKFDRRELPVPVITGR